MVGTEGSHRADVERGGPRKGRGPAALIITLALVALAAILFFWLFDVDVTSRGEFEVPEVNADIDAPDVDVEGGDLPDVDVNPADEGAGDGDEANAGG